MKPDEQLLDREQSLVTSALREAGLEVESVYDLVNDRRSFTGAVDPLLRLLPSLKHPRIKEGVVRALTDPAARGKAAKPLVRELRRAMADGDELYAWTVGNALRVVADDSVFEDLLELAQDKRLGGGRETVVESLGGFKERPEALTVLVDLLKDEDVAGHAIVALRRLRARTASQAIAPLLEHKKAWVRREAKKAMRVLDSGGSPPEGG